MFSLPIFLEIGELPFDLRSRRLAVYNMPEAEKERAKGRALLQKVLDDSIRAALAHAPASETSVPSIAAIEEAKPNRTLILRRQLDDILQKLEAGEPKKPRDDGTAEELIAGIAQTQETVAEFSKVAEVIAVMNDSESALTVCRWFGRLFEKYHLPDGFAGTYNKADFDYFKFLGHELFVTFIAFLIREQRWDLLSAVLNEPIPVAHLPHEHGPGTARWEFASEHMLLLADEAQKRSRMSLHADILHARHTKDGGLGKVLPFDDFVAADFFLFLFGELPPPEAPSMFIEWRPWSTLYLQRAPMFMRSAEVSQTAEKIAKVLKTGNIAELKKRLTERAPRLAKLFSSGWWDYPIRTEDIERIGTR